MEVRYYDLLPDCGWHLDRFGVAPTRGLGFRAVFVGGIHTSLCNKKLCLYLWFVLQTLTKAGTDLRQFLMFNMGLM